MISVRKYIDCREFPSDNNCTLKISGTEQEVITAALSHAVTSHGHQDTPEFRKQLTAGLREER